MLSQRPIGFDTIAAPLLKSITFARLLIHVWVARPASSAQWIAGFTFRMQNAPSARRLGGGHYGRLAHLPRASKLQCDAITIAAAARLGRGRIDGVIFQTRPRFVLHCLGSITLYRNRLGVRKSTGRCACFDNGSTRHRRCSLLSAPSTNRHGTCSAD